MGAHDNALLMLVDEKTRLAGSNRMERLLFSLGGSETFGINVFKVREVCDTSEITRAPNMPRGVDSISSLREAGVEAYVAKFNIESPAATIAGIPQPKVA